MPQLDMTCVRVFGSQCWQGLRCIEQDYFGIDWNRRELVSLVKLCDMTQ